GLRLTGSRGAVGLRVNPPLLAMTLSLGSSPMVESIGRDGEVFCYVVRTDSAPASTTFVTPDDAIQQVGFVVHNGGSEVRRHYHLPIERQIAGTPEVLIVRSGRCEMDVFDDAQQHVATRELTPGDVMVMVGGGHGF